jgi:RecJ-like exonuclease
MEGNRGMTHEKLQKVADSADYQDFELRHNRHLNMLQDNVRSPFKNYTSLGPKYQKIRPH